MVFFYVNRLLCFLIFHNLYSTVIFHEPPTINRVINTKTNTQMHITLKIRQVKTQTKTVFFRVICKYID